MKTIGLIPCAGKGSRLGLPFSKEMFPDVHSEEFRPIILHTIEAFKKAGIIDIIITFNPNKTDLLNYLGNGKQFGVNLSYCMHPIAKSLPESLNEAYHLIRDKRVVFAMPDTIIQPEEFVIHALNFHEKEQATISLGCFKTENPTSVSVVDFDIDGKNITKVIEKPQSTSLEWMWGMMIWEWTFSETLNLFCINSKVKAGTNELYLSDALTPHIQKKEVKGIRFTEGSYRDLGTFQEIIRWSKNQ